MKTNKEIKQFIEELQELFVKHDLVIDVFSDFNGQLYEKSTGEWVCTLDGHCRPKLRNNE